MVNINGYHLVEEIWYKATVVIEYHLVEEIWYGATVINGTVVNTMSWWIKSGKELLWNY